MRILLFGGILAAALAAFPGLTLADPPDPSPEPALTAVANPADAAALGVGVMALELRAADAAGDFALTPQPDHAAMIPPDLIIRALRGELPAHDPGDGDETEAYALPVPGGGPPAIADS